MKPAKLLYEVRKVIDDYEYINRKTPNTVILPYNTFSILKADNEKFLKKQIPDSKWKIFGLDIIVSEDRNAKIQCLTAMK